MTTVEKSFDKWHVHCTLDRFDNERNCAFVYEFSFTDKNSYGLMPEMQFNPRSHIVAFLWPWLLPSAELVQAKMGDKVFRSEDCVERPEIKSSTCSFDPVAAEAILNTLTTGGEVGVELLTNSEIYQEPLNPSGYGSALATMEEGLGISSAGEIPGHNP
ncbi:hypothetical protein [Candidatus Binatus sp.]|uniref:hypothetical protein n=1 Tax=Candidatus Binatus sp. TaxID=2811406 RepID=UPI003CB9D5F5